MVTTFLEFCCSPFLSCVHLGAVIKLPATRPPQKDQLKVNCRVWQEMAKRTENAQDLLDPFVPSDLGAGCREHRGRPLAEHADWLCWQLSKFTEGLRDTYLRWQGTEPDLGAVVWEKIPLLS